MRITTLGTSHGDATYCRFQSSTLYEIGEKAYLIDAGQPVDALLTRRGFPIMNISAVFLTHMHSDHVAGLPQFIAAFNKYNGKAAMAHNRPEHKPDRCTVFFPESGVTSAMEAWMSAMHRNVVQNYVSYQLTQPGVIFDDGNLRVQAIRTRHLGKDTPSYAYVLQAEGKTVLHTGDLASDFSDFPGLSVPCDLCICEATHYKPETALPVFEKCRFGALWFTHIHNPWHGETGERDLLSRYKTLPFPVSVAHDGDSRTI